MVAIVIGFRIGQFTLIKCVPDAAHIEGGVVGNKRALDAGPEYRPIVLKTRSLRNVIRGNAVNGDVEWIEDRGVWTKQLMSPFDNVAIFNHSEPHRANRRSRTIRSLEVYSSKPHSTHAVENQQ